MGSQQQDAAAYILLADTVKEILAAEKHKYDEDDEYIEEEDAEEV